MQDTLFERLRCSLRQPCVVCLSKKYRDVVIKYFTIISFMAFLAIGAQAQTKGAPAPATNQAEAYDRLDPIAKKVRRLADELRSPFCPGKSISNCTSYQAFELRKKVYEMFQSGMTEPEILAALEERHGDEITNPSQPWYTFFVPFLPFLCLGLLIFWVVSRWRRADDSSELEDTGAVEAEGDDRLERLRARVRSHED